MLTSYPRWVPWLAVVLVGVAAFSAGRFSAPREVEERVEYRTEWKTKTVEVVKWRTAKSVASKTTTTPVLLAAPDGGVVLAATTTIETREHETGSGGSESTSEANRNSSGETQRKVTQQPDWRIGAQVGASLRDPLLPIAGPLVFGVTVDRRISGGVSAGLWGSTVGAAGVGVSVEF